MNPKRDNPPIPHPSPINPKHTTAGVGPEPDTAETRFENTSPTGHSNIVASSSQQTEILDDAEDPLVQQKLPTGSQIAAAAESHVELAPGTRLQQYELIRELGRGGMGQVFLVRDTKLGRKVAVKFLHERYRKYSKRFLIEARATAQCSHENIVVIHEVNEHQGLSFMVLEYLEGESLGDLIDGHSMPINRAVQLIIPVLRALERAHTFNIIHRDLKPDNIVVTNTGVVKVLDFGIAKMFSSNDEDIELMSTGERAQIDVKNDVCLTREGTLMGTALYMSPEQWGVDSIDHRVDLWAVGVILWEMLAGRNPLAGRNMNQIAANAARLEEPMPDIGQERPDLPAQLVEVVGRCLAKRKAKRYDSAREVLDILEPLMPGQRGRRLAAEESPFPGLTAFQESDADRFFGRDQEINQMISRIREFPLLGVVGPSGVGKSSFVRAGVVPALKALGEEWEVVIARPGRHPLEGLAGVLEPFTRTQSQDISPTDLEGDSLSARLFAEPGYFGTALRKRSRRNGTPILVFVDQFEELYTLVADAAVRAAFTSCLVGAADDVTSPVRVVVSMRSDFLDRAAEDQRFIDDLTRGLTFLQPPTGESLRDALIQPVEMNEFQFESQDIVDDILRTLQSSPGALPLLQFTASKLWENRDRRRKVLTMESYLTMGGTAGALASHADEVLGTLSHSAQKLAQTILLRLVTSEGTRAIADVSDLCELSADGDDVKRLIDNLVKARLLVVQTGSDAESTAVEIVHESLISEWPTLKKWLDESRDDAVFLEQLRAAAKQWHDRSRAQGLLWRGEAMIEARRWRDRYQDPVPRLDQDYLDAVFQMANRSSRRRRLIVLGSFIVLVGLVIAGGVALVLIRNAEQESRSKAQVAKTEASRAREAEKQVKGQIQMIRAKEQEKQTAEKAANSAKAEVKVGQVKLDSANVKIARTNQELKVALTRAQDESVKARAASFKAVKAAKRIKKLADEQKQANLRLKLLLAKERARVQRLKRMKRKIATDLD